MYCSPSRKWYIIRSTRLFKACIVLLQAIGLYFHQNRVDFYDRDTHGFVEARESNISCILLILTVILTIGHWSAAIVCLLTLPHMNYLDEKFNSIWMNVWNVLWIALYQIIATVFIWKCKQISIMFKKLCRLFLKTPKKAISAPHVLSMILLVSMSIVSVLTDMNYNIISYPKVFRKQSVTSFFWFLWINNTIIDVAFILIIIVTTLNLSNVLEQPFVEILNLKCNIFAKAHKVFRKRKKIPSQAEIVSFHEKIPSGSSGILEGSYITNQNNLMDSDLESKLSIVENTIIEVYDCIELMMSIFGFYVLLWLLFGTWATTLSMYFGISSLAEGTVETNFLVLFIWRLGGMLFLCSAPEDFNKTVSNILGHENYLICFLIINDINLSF